MQIESSGKKMTIRSHKRGLYTVNCNYCFVFIFLSSLLVLQCIVYLALGSQKNRNRKKLNSLK